MDSVGKYFIVREGWRCNICGKMFFTNKKRKPHCHSAPYFLSNQVELEIPRKLFLKIKKLNNE